MSNSMLDESLDPFPGEALGAVSNIPGAQIITTPHGVEIKLPAVEPVSDPYMNLAAARALEMFTKSQPDMKN